MAAAARPLIQSPVSSSSSPQSKPFKIGRNFIAVRADGTIRTAKLIAKRRLKIPFPDSSRLEQFLSEPAGMQTLINTNALQKFQRLDDTTYRCYLPKLEILSFEVAPIIDLFIDVTSTECMVKLLSCKFEGSELVEKQNEHFSAFMMNHLTWDPDAVEEQLNVNVELNVSLEVYTLPFRLLPLAAVETPGSIVLQAMVDRLVPIFLDHLFDDYRKWSASNSAEMLALKSGSDINRS